MSNLYDPVLGRAVRDAVIDLDDLREEMGPNLTRGIWISPEGDCENSCQFGSERCKKGHGGWHGYWSREVMFYVSSPGRAGVAMDLHVPIWTEAARARRRDPLATYIPLGTLSLHVCNPTEEAKTRLYSRYMEENACVITGTLGECWSDATYLQAETAANLLVDGGPTAVWSWLAEAWLLEALQLCRETS